MKRLLVLSLLILASITVLAGEVKQESLSGTSNGEAQIIRITRKESLPSTQGTPDHFTGRVRIAAPFRGEAPARVSGAKVTFEAGSRTAWHSHAMGQTLIITEGAGLIQRWGDPVQTMRQGDVVWIPPSQKHWHGATPDASMTHIAIVEHLEGQTAEWFEQVSDEQYRSSTPEAKKAEVASGGKTVAQLMFGDIAPKFAQLTDEVLYADLWERSELSKRDRSLITVAALVAMNRPPQLKSHLRLALKNGVTKDELIELITHLAFYAGWPNSVTAVVTAKEEFEDKGTSAP